MSKKTRIMVLLFLIASFCVACGKTDLNVKSEFTYDSGKLNESEDSNTVETEQVVKLVEPLELGEVIAQYVGNAAPNIPAWVAQFSFGFYSLMLTSTLIGLIVMALYKPRSWCAFCPMGTMTQTICKIKARI